MTVFTGPPVYSVAFDQSGRYLYWVGAFSQQAGEGSDYVFLIDLDQDQPTSTQLAIPNRQIQSIYSRHLMPGGNGTANLKYTTQWSECSMIETGQSIVHPHRGVSGINRKTWTKLGELGQLIIDFRIKWNRYWRADWDGLYIDTPSWLRSFYEESYFNLEGQTCFIDSVHSLMEENVSGWESDTDGGLLIPADNSIRIRFRNESPRLEVYPVGTSHNNWECLDDEPRYVLTIPYGQPDWCHNIAIHSKKNLIGIVCSDSASGEVFIFEGRDLKWGPIPFPAD